MKRTCSLAATKIPIRTRTSSKLGVVATKIPMTTTTVVVAVAAVEEADDVK